MNGRKRWAVATVLAIATSVTAAAAAHAQQAPMKMPDPMDLGRAYEELSFEAADTDGNNVISEGEFIRDAAAGFSGLDRNHDGKLTPQELGPHDPRKFARIDADGDGTLTFNEVMTFKMKAFKAADTGGDGGLSFQEVVESVKAEDKSY
ncbi:MAG TPA: hypothetical protein VES39_02020 [Rhodospirillales bacterium]|nr:hypothetical protein [Rhodospirillales bacterium]